MGRKSTRENKNIYQQSREKLGLTREAASDLLGYISADRIEKIESAKSTPYPEEIISMADCYKNPMLCNYFCTHECKIGQVYVPEVELKDISQITLEMLATLNTLNREKERLIEITLDGNITQDEFDDFQKIQDQLDKMSLTIESLKLWVNHMIANGRIKGLEI